MNKTDIYIFIQEVVKELTNLDIVIMADPNAPSPTSTYCSVYISNTADKIAAPIIDNKYIVDDEQIELSYLQLIRNEVVLNFYGKDSLDNASKLYNSLYTEYVKLKSYQKNIYINSIGSIINLTALQSNNFEERAKMSIFVEYMVGMKEIVNSIEKFEINVKTK